MKTDVRHYGKITPEGKIIFTHPELWDEQRLALRGNDFELIIKKRVKKPSVDQFSYLFGGILRSIMNTNQFSHYDNPKELFEEIFSPMYLSYQVMAKAGKKRWLVNKERHLSDLSKEEMGELIDKMLIYCGQEGIEILDKEQYSNKFYKEINLDE